VIWIKEGVWARGHCPPNLQQPADVALTIDKDEALGRIPVFPELPLLLLARLAALAGIQRVTFCDDPSRDERATTEKSMKSK
jgi:hypothetical protein